MKNDLEIRIESIMCCRDLSSQYIEGAIDWFRFWEALPKNFAPFDPLDLSLEGLTKEQQEEIQFYVEWYENEDRIPRNPEWQYGKSNEPYGWIDKDKYLVDFSNAFLSLKKKTGI